LFGTSSSAEASNILVNKKGTLRVYFVAVGDHDAHIGLTEPWRTPIWTAPVPEASSALLAKQVNIPAEAIPDNVQVETFVDNDFPRPAADDIYFTKRRPVATRIPERSREIPLFVMTPVFAAGALALGKKRRPNA
jgi:hypothetical protein